MPIPAEILAVERPKNTRVKKSGDRYLVIKRTCKRIDGRNVPVELGTIGEIANGQYIEIRKEPRGRSTVDVLDYGEYALCSKAAGNLLQELADIFDVKTAKALFCIAMLRVADRDVKDRDLKFAYDTSYLSVAVPGVSLSENTVSKLLQEVGMNYSAIHAFMLRRMQRFSGGTLVVDGMPKDNNSTTNSYSEYSRKGSKKGSEDINIIYAYDLQSKEPAAIEIVPGNMLDYTPMPAFIERFNIRNGLGVFDKGFSNAELIRALDALESFSYIIPMKTNSRAVTESGACDDILSPLVGYRQTTVFYKKTKIGSKWYYAFRNPQMAADQEKGFVEYGMKKGSFSEEKLRAKHDRFGVIVFMSKSDLDPLTVYEAYASRWEIEVMFNLFKNIIERSTVYVHGDYRLYATEFVNFLSVIIASRVKHFLATTALIDPTAPKKSTPKPIGEVYSWKQVFRFLAKVKKVRISTSDRWFDTTTLKYVQVLKYSLGI